MKLEEFFKCGALIRLKIYIQCLCCNESLLKSFKNSMMRDVSFTCRITILHKGLALSLIKSFLDSFSSKYLLTLLIDLMILLVSNYRNGVL